MAGPNPFRPFRPWWQRLLFRPTRRVDLQQKFLFTRQLASMVSAHVPLLRALECFAQCPEPEPIHRVVSRVSQRVVGGSSLSAAMRSHPEAFDEVYLGMIYSGETTGRLHLVLEKLAEQIEKQHNLERRIRASLTYPVILLLAAATSVVFFMFGILPILQPMFLESGVALPWPTRVLLGIRDAMPFLLLGLVLVILGLVALRRAMKAQPGLRLRVHRLLLLTPVAGSLYHSLSMTRIMQNMALMFEVGLNANKVLQVCEKLTPNAYLIQQLALLRRLVMEGELMSEAMQRSNVFPAVGVQFVAAGEESSELSKLLARASEIQSTQNDHQLETLPQIIEPIIMMGMGITVAFVILASLLPIVSLIEGL